MDKEKLKKGLFISGIIFSGLALAITYFFVIYSNEAIGVMLNKVVVILRPFIVGAIIAYILKSTCNAYEKMFIKALSKRKQADKKKDAKRANTIAVILTYITWVVIVGALLWIAIPQIIESISNFVHDLINNMPMYVETAQNWLINLKESYPDLATSVDQIIEKISVWLTTDLPTLLPEIGENIVFGAIDVVNVLKDVAIGLVLSVFFLSGRKVFAKKTTLLINTLFKERQSEAIVGEARFADRMFSGFLEGKIIDSTIIGIIYFIALVLMDIKYAALLALICGVTNIIPFFGPFIGAVPSGLIILMSNEDPIQKLIFFIIFVCVIQFIDGNIIDPHIVGGNIKLSPFCVIFAVLLFGGLWGFTGLLIGVPTFAVIYDIIKKLIYYRLKKSGKKHILKAHLEEFGNLKRRSETAEKLAADATSENTEEAIAPSVPEPDTSLPDTNDANTAPENTEEEKKPSKPKMGKK